MRGVRRALATVLLATATAWAATGVAWAHGGPRVATVDAGPYVIEVFLLTADQGDDTIQVDVTLFLRDRRTLRPVDEAQVAVTYRVRGKVLGTFPAVSFGNQYDVILLGPKADRWEMEVTVEGPSGPGRGVAELPLRSGSPLASLAAWVLLMVLVAIIFLALFRRYTRGW